MIRALIYISYFSILFSQTTGKISGVVSDGKDATPLPGANIYIEQTKITKLMQ